MIPSVIRTVVPYLVAYLVALLVGWGIDVPAEVETWLTETLVLVLGTGYYVAARWLERHGVTLPLLGSRQQPEYAYVGRHRAED